MTHQKILVTGAAGFIGSRVVERINQKGIDIVSVDIPEAFETRPEHVHLGLSFGEIIERDLLLDQLDTLEVDGIIHMGACSNTTEMDLDYIKRVNTDYSKALWNYATQKKIPFVYASSAATYGEGEHGYDDDESLMSQLKPLNPYGQSKLDFDLWALEQEKAGHHPPNWSGFKFFNVYGFGERHKGKMASVVLHAFDQIHSAGFVKLFQSHRDGIEDGHQKRDFIFVDDVVDALEHALFTPITRGVFNLGTGHARTFLDLVKATYAGLEKEPKIEFIPTPESLRERYQYFTQAEMERLRIEGFDIQFTSLEEGAKKYVQQLLDFFKKD